MDDVMELPRIDEALFDTPAPVRTEVAIAAANAADPAFDLAKVDLAQLAIAKLGDWRPIVAKLKADNTNTVHDLSTQSKVDEAVSLRNRTVNVPVAFARKTEKALASAMTQARKKLGTELESLELAYADAAVPLTKQIDDAQKKLDDAKEAKRLAEQQRLDGLRADIDGIMARWLDRCAVEGITAVRIGMGIGMLQELAMPAESADVAGHWTTAKAATLATMATLEREAAHREQEARLEAQRVELNRQRWELMHQQMDVAREAAVLRVGETAQAVHTAFLETHGPSEQWADLVIGQAYVQAMGVLQPPAADEIEAAPQGVDAPAVESTSNTEGTAVTPGAGNAEAAPINPVCEGTHCGTTDGRGHSSECIAEHDAACGIADTDTTQQASQLVLKAEAAAPDATDRETPATASPVGGPMGTGQPAAAGPAAGTRLAFTTASAPATLAVPIVGVDVIEGSPLQRAAGAVMALVKQARAGKFPAQPKVSVEWWAAMYAAVQQMEATGEAIEPAAKEESH